MSRRSATPLPFHYTPIVRELTEALQHLLQANDWKETPPLGTSDADALRSERGNVQAAVSHALNAFTALEKRDDDLFTALKIYEHQAMNRPGVAADLRAVADAERGRTQPLSLNDDGDLGTPRDGI